VNTLLLLAALVTTSADEAVASAQPTDNSGAESARPAAAAFRIVENSAGEAVVGKLEFPNAKPEKSLRFAITAGNTGDAFAINAETGEISVHNGGALDFETHPVFTLTVRVTESADEGDQLRRKFAEQLKKSGADDDAVRKVLERTADHTVTIELTDVNEPPVMEPRPFRIVADWTAGTAVGTLSADDPDQGETLSYAAGDPATASFFAVDEVTGEITLSDPAALADHLDRGNASRFLGSFLVTDSAGASHLASVSIAVDPAPPAPFEFEPTPVEPAAPSVTPDAPPALITSTEPQSDPVQGPSDDPETPADPVTAAVEPQVVEPQAIEPQSIAPQADPSTAEPTQSAGSFGTLWALMNLLITIGLVGAGLWLHRSSKAVKHSHGRSSAERENLTTLQRSLEAFELELEQQKKELAQVEQKLAAKEEELNAKHNELASQEEELSSRAQQLQAQHEELEAKQAELVEGTERLVAEQEALAAEKELLAEAAADLESKRQELLEMAARIQAQEAAGSQTAIESIEATEHLVGLAAGVDEPASEAESEEVVQLRHRLADMFGVAESELVRHRGPRAETEYEGIVKAQERAHFEQEEEELASDESYAAEEPAAAEAEAPAACESAAEEPDSVASYMRDLLERQRVRQMYGSSPSFAPKDMPKPAAAPPIPRPAPTAAPAAQSAEVSAEPPKPVSNSPIHPQNKEAVRSDLDSLRQVANQAARSAVMKHAKRKLRSHSLIKISCAAASFLVAGVVLSSSIPANALFGWVAFGIGTIMLVDLAHWTYVTHKRTAPPSREQN